MLNKSTNICIVLKKVMIPLYLYLFFLQELFIQLFYTTKQYQMEAIDSYQLEERHNTSVIMPHPQQYQYHNQQNQSPLAAHLINSQYPQQYLVETIVCQESSQFARASSFSLRTEQKTVSIEQYRGIQLEYQRLQLLNEQLNNQVEQLKKGLKNGLQSTLEQERKKQFDFQDVNPTTPQKRKSRNSVKQGEDKTGQSKHQLSNQKDDLYEKQLEQYKMMLKSEEKKVLQCQQKLQNSQKKNKKLRQQYIKSEQRCKKVQKKKQNLQEQTQFIQNENDKVHEILQQERSRVKSLQEQINMRNSLEQQKNQEIGDLKYTISLQKTKILTLQEQIQIINEMKQKLCKDLQNLRKEYSDKIAYKDNIIQTLTRQNEAIKKSLQYTISQKENQITQIQSLNNKLQSEKKTLQTTIRNLESNVEKLKQQSRKLKTEKEAQKTKLQGQLKEAKNQKQALARNILSLDQQLKKQKETSQKFKKEKEAEKKQLQTKINELNNTLKKNQLILAEKQRQYSIDIRQRDDQIMRQMNQKQEMLDLILKYKAILKPICEHSNLPFNETNINIDIGQLLKNQILKGKYFQESVILNQAQPQKRQFLFKQLTSFLSIPTFKSQLLFKYDPILPKNNFFNYILDKKNLLVLVKLINGTTIGGFTVFPFGKDIQRPGKGFIFSLTLEKAFKMKNQPKVPVIQNDAFFLIMGSSEIRLKYNQNKFFTNFGVAAATFDSNGSTKPQFLGVNEQINEIEFQSYEIYAINWLQ